MKIVLELLVVSLAILALQNNGESVGTARVIIGSFGAPFLAVAVNGTFHYKTYNQRILLKSKSTKGAS